MLSEDHMQVLTEEQTSPILTAWQKACAHVSGGAMGTTVSVLERHGTIEALRTATSPVSVDMLTRDTGIDRAYGHLAMQLLATQGLTTCDAMGTERATVALTDDGRDWAEHAAAYERFDALLADAVALRAALGGSGDRVPNVARAGATDRARAALAAAPPELAERIRRHLRGPLVAVAIGEMSGVRAFRRIVRSPLGWCPLDSIDLPRPALDACVTVLAEEGWLQPDDDLVFLTPDGQIGVRWLALYGYLVGYLGVLRQVPALLGHESIPDQDPTVVKSDADRDLLLSGKAQVFARGGLREPLEEIVRQVFDDPDLDAQPRLLLDISVGDGSVLQAMYETIRGQTRRGAALDRRPLTLVGLASSPLARDRAADRLASAGIGCLLLQAPIEDPDALVAELSRAGLDLREALVIAKTCIHGRRYRGTAGVTIAPREGEPSHAVFVTPEGTLVAPEDLEDDLAAFFARWARWVGRHGLVAADAHTVPAEIAAQSRAVNVQTHVCATHGYSAQYLIEAEIFRRAARRGGLTSRSSRDLGNELLGATSMTLDHFVAARPSAGGTGVGTPARRDDA